MLKVPRKARGAGSCERSSFSKLSPPQRPPTVAPWEKYTRGARRLERGKIKARGEFSGVY